MFNPEKMESRCDRVIKIVSAEKMMENIYFDQQSLSLRENFVPSTRLLTNPRDYLHSMLRHLQFSIMVREVVKKKRIFYGQADRKG